MQVILDGMKWLNLDYDEGPVYQMDRLARYQEVVDDMLADGCASSSVPPVSSLAMTAAGVRKTVWDAPFPKA